MGLWITKRKEDKKTCWDVEITKGDSGYVEIALEDLQAQKIELREQDIVSCQVRSEQGTLLIEGTASKLEDGNLLWRIAPENTEGIEVGEYLWDMQVEIPDSGDVFTFVPTSNFVISAEQTRRRRCQNE